MKWLMTEEEEEATLTVAGRVRRNQRLLVATQHNTGAHNTKMKTDTKGSLFELPVSSHTPELHYQHALSLLTTIFFFFKK